MNASSRLGRSTVGKPLAYRFVRISYAARPLGVSPASRCFIHSRFTIHDSLPLRASASLRLGVRPIRSLSSTTSRRATQFTDLRFTIYYLQMTDLRREWNESAPYWDKYRDIMRAMFMPLTEALIEDAHIAPGHSVLDVAGGAGEPSLTIADTVGPGGSVTCTDFASEMVEAARSEAARRGLTNITFRQCSADALPFADNTFDVAVSRLGVMFFPDVPAALREMLRVVKPGGSVAFLVWRGPEVNPFFSVTSAVVSRYVEPAPEEPDAPNAFRFAESGKLAGLLKSLSLRSSPSPAVRGPGVSERGFRLGEGPDGVGSNSLSLGYSPSPAGRGPGVRERGFRLGDGPDVSGYAAVDVRERILKSDIAAPVALEDYWEFRSAISDSLRSKLAGLSAEQKSQIAKEVQSVAARFFLNNQMNFPSETLIVSGRKAVR